MAKCEALTIVNSGQKKYVDNHSPLLGADHIPALSFEDRYKYLGCNLGADPRAELKAMSETFLSDCSAVLTSMLTDWQKLDAS